MRQATELAARFLEVMPRVALSRLAGRAAELPLPAPVARAIVGGYCAFWRVDLAEAEASAQPYGSLNALFTRRLRPGARPIAAAALVAPADGLLRATGRIAGSTLVVKGNQYRVSELTGAPEDDARYGEGTYAVIYLSPRDYHRVHAPVDGEAIRVTGIPGDLFPVNALGERVPHLYARNSRVAIRLETRDFGEVTVVMVGAMIVGRMGIDVMGGGEAAVGVTEFAPGRPLTRGDELGAFHVGSSVVVCCERELGIVLPGRRVRYGESLLVPS